MRGLRVFCLAVAMAPLGMPSLVHAASLVDVAGTYVSEEAGRIFLADALTKVHREKCESDIPCAPASQADIDHPPITVVEARAAMAHGMVSAMAQWCGLNWHRSFVPMIGYGKYHEKMSDRQLVLMTLIHGNMQARQVIIYRSAGPCPDKLRRQLDDEMPKNVP